MVDAPAAVTTVVRPTVVLHPRGAVADDLATADLVPLHEGLRRPPFPWAALATFGALLVVLVAVALAGGPVPADGTVTVERPVDLAEPVELTTPPGFDLTGSRLAVGVMGVELDSAEVTGTSADLGGARYLAAGPVTAELALPDGSRHLLAVDPAQPPLLTVPGAVGVGGALFVLAYAESLLRSLRRGRKTVSATAGLTALGLVAGVVAVDLAWLAGRPPTVGAAAAAALLGGLAGLALARVGTGIGRRRG